MPLRRLAPALPLLVLLLALAAPPLARAQRDPDACGDPAYRLPEVLAVACPLTLTPPGFLPARFGPAVERVAEHVRARVEALGEGGLLPNGTRLEAALLDTALKAPAAARAAVEAFAGADASGGARRLVAMLSDFSTPSEAAGLVSSSLGVPLLSFVASTPSLSDKGPYGSVVRVRSAYATGESAATVAVLRAAGWDRVAAVTTSSELGVGIAAHLSAEAARAGVHVAGLAYGVVDGVPSDESLDAVFSRVAEGRHRVVLLSPSNSDDVAPALASARRHGVTADRGVVFVLSSLARVGLAAAGAEGLATVRGGLALEGQLPFGRGYAPYERYAAAAAGRVPDISELWGVDAWDALELALRSLVRDCEDVTPEALHARVLAASFDGVSGNVRFDEAGDRVGAYTVLNLGADGDAAVPVATLDDAPGASLVAVQGASVVWPGGASGPLGSGAAPRDTAPEADEPLLSAAGAGVLAGALAGALLLAGAAYFFRAKTLETRAAVRSADAQRRFAAFAFHEVRNPLHGVAAALQFARAALKAGDAGAAARDLDAADASCRRAVDVAADVVGLAGLAGAGAQARPPPQPVLLDALLPGGPRVDADASLPAAVLADVPRLRHALHNLVAAAAGGKAEEEEVEVRLAAAGAGDAGSAKLLHDGGDGAALRVRFEVRGPGGRAHCCGDGAFARDRDLGLHVASEFVRLLGGALEAEPLGAAGVAFSFTLPLEAVPEAAAAPPVLDALELEVLDARPPESALRGWRVLVVDDSAVNRGVLERVLTAAGPFAALGWSVASAATGEEALERMLGGRERFDLIVVDQNMAPAGGRLLGTDVVRRVRENAATLGAGATRPRALLAVCSGTCEEEDLEAYLAAGADLAWTKPLATPEALRAQVEARVVEAGVEV